MSDNDNNNDTPQESNVIDFAAIRAGAKAPPKDVDVRIKTRVAEGRYEFHLHPNENAEFDTVVEAEGYLKFGPQFIAVVDGPEDDSQVTFAVATPFVKYVKRVGEQGEVQGTLSL